VAVRGDAGFTGLVDLGAIAAVAAAERQWLRAHDALFRFAAVEEDAPLLDVARVLERSGVSQIPVVRGGEIVGWIGERELRRALMGS
jgi:CBS domain-containing protein